MNNVNSTNDINHYADNTSSQFNTGMDSFTVTMTLTIPVNSGELKSIRVGIAKLGDSSCDSNLLIAANSIEAALDAGADIRQYRDERI